MIIKMKKIKEKKTITIEHIEYDDGSIEIIRKHKGFDTFGVISALEITKHNFLMQITEGKHDISRKKG